MSQRAPGAPSKAEADAMKRRWEALPEVQDFSDRMLAQVRAEKLEFDAAGVSRAFAIANEQGQELLPDSGLRAWG